MAGVKGRPKKYFVDPEWFREVYTLQQRPVREIAEQIGCGVFHVKYFAQKFGLEIRNGRRGRTVLSRRTAINLEEATRLYVDKKWPCDKIANCFGCHTTTVLRRLRESGVKIRHHNDTKRGAKARNRIEIDSNAIVAEYREEWSAVPNIAKKYGVSNRVIYRILTEAGEPRKSIALARNFNGTNSPRWRHDLTAEEREHRRDINAQAEWRLKVYQRDRFTCQKCGHEGSKLNAHHIEPHYRNRDIRWEVSNGITLCAECHRKYHRTYGHKRCSVETLTIFLGVLSEAA